MDALKFQLSKFYRHHHLIINLLHKHREVCIQTMCIAHIHTCACMLSRLNLICVHTMQESPPLVWYGCCLPITLMVTIDIGRTSLTGRYIMTVKQILLGKFRNHSLHLHVTSSCVITIYLTLLKLTTTCPSLGDSQVTLEQSMPVT